MITKNDFKDKVKRLERFLKRDLAFNIWQGHFSVYTLKEGADYVLLVQDQTAKGAVAQISAILNLIYLQNEEREGGDPMYNGFLTNEIQSDESESNYYKQCECGHEFETKKAEYLGTQSGKLKLYNCPKCGSTVAVKIKKEGGS